MRIIGHCTYLSTYLGTSDYLRVCTFSTESTDHHGWIIVKKESESAPLLPGLYIQTTYKWTSNSVTFSSFCRMLPHSLRHAPAAYRGGDCLRINSYYGRSRFNCREVKVWGQDCDHVVQRHLGVFWIRVEVPRVLATTSCTSTSRTRGLMIVGKGGIRRRWEL